MKNEQTYYLDPTQASGEPLTLRCPDGTREEFPVVRGTRTKSQAYAAAKAAALLHYANAQKIFLGLVVYRMDGPFRMDIASQV